MKNRIKEYWTDSALPGTEVLVNPRRPRNHTRRQAIVCALRGLHQAWCTQPNLRIHVYVALLVIAFGMACQLVVVEWLWISFAIGLVIFAELMNTAIEQTVDLVVGLRPDPLAGRVKDMAAGFVLVSTLVAVLIGCFTFGPRLLTY